MNAEFDRNMQQAKDVIAEFREMVRNNKKRHALWEKKIETLEQQCSVLPDDEQRLIALFMIAEIENVRKDEG